MRNIEEVIDATIRDMGSWLHVTVEFKGLFISDFLRDWVTSISPSPPANQIQKDRSWKPLPHGILKLNVDGASKEKQGPADYGCAVRNHDGILIKALCGPLVQCDSTMAKTRGLLKGLKELKKMGQRSYLMERDSEVVIGWGQGKECNAWRLWSLVDEILEMSSELEYSFRHVHREQNSLADYLANWGVVHHEHYNGSCMPF